MRHVSRRALIGAVPACAAAVVTPAAAMASPEPENPWSRMWRLTWELADALAAIDGGDQMAIIYPTGERPYPVMVGSIEAHEQGKVFVRPELRQAVERHDDVWGRFIEACRWEAEFGVNDKLPEDKQAIKDALDKEERAGFRAICAFRCYNKAEEEFRARYVKMHLDRDECWNGDVLEIMVAAVAGEAQT